MRTRILIAIACLFFGCAKEELASKPKSWPLLANEYFGVVKDQTNEYKDSAIIPTFQLVTKWAEGRMFYIFTLDPATPKLNAERENIWSKAFFIFQLKDADGFIRIKKGIYLSQMTAIVDALGRPTKYEIRDDLETSRKVYESLLDWSVTWSGIK